MQDNLQLWNAYWGGIRAVWETIGVEVMHRGYVQPLVILVLIGSAALAIYRFFVKGA